MRQCWGCKNARLSPLRVIKIKPSSYSRKCSPLHLYTCGEGVPYCFYIARFPTLVVCYRKKYLFMHSDIDGVCANDTGAHKPAASWWGTCWSFKYSLDPVQKHTVYSRKGAWVCFCVQLTLDWGLPSSVGFLEEHDLLNRGTIEPLNLCG